MTHTIDRPPTKLSMAFQSIESEIAAFGGKSREVVELHAANVTASILRSTGLFNRGVTPYMAERVTDSVLAGLDSAPAIEDDQLARRASRAAFLALYNEGMLDLRKGRRPIEPSRSKHV